MLLAKLSHFLKDKNVLFDKGHTHVIFFPMPTPIVHAPLDVTTRFWHQQATAGYNLTPQSINNPYQQYNKDPNQSDN
jgi:hypothetical protein